MQQGTQYDAVASGKCHNCFYKQEPDIVSNEERDKYATRFHPYPVITAKEMSPGDSETCTVHANSCLPASDVTTSTSDNDSVLIKPRSVVTTYMTSKERQALHRELLANYKIGKYQLKQPELNQVLKERREKQRIQEWDEQKALKRRTSLEVKLEQRANRLEEEEDKSMKMITEEMQTLELTRVHRKITLKFSKSTEFP